MQWFMQTIDISLRCRQRLPLVLPTLLVLCAAASPAALSGKDLAAALQRGGYVILMRHASSPRTPPDPAQADPDNVHHERQLDETGRTSARAMGEAFHRLRIPVGEVLSSPTYRALETARLAGFGPAQTHDQLGDAGQSMTPDATGTRGAWLHGRVTQLPRESTNTLIITHAPNIREAFPTEGADLADGEALIFRPDGHGGAAVVARVKIQDWPRLAATSRLPASPPSINVE